VSTKAGSNIKFDNIPNNKVKEINPPNAIVPPKLDSIRQRTQNNTIEV
jgi:hypothetical protein